MILPQERDVETYCTLMRQQPRLEAAAGGIGFVAACVGAVAIAYSPQPGYAPTQRALCFYAFTLALTMAAATFFAAARSAARHLGRILGRGECIAIVERSEADPDITFEALETAALLAIQRGKGERAVCLLREIAEGYAIGLGTPSATYALQALARD